MGFSWSLVRQRPTPSIWDVAHSLKSIGYHGEFSISGPECMSSSTIILNAVYLRMPTNDSAFWTAVAPRYANNTNVIYELKNEPDFLGFSGSSEFLKTSSII